MNKKLYGDNGYLDFKYIFALADKHHCPYISIIGGRGTGKTYGALKYVIENNINFGYMRRTQTQADLIRSDKLSPFKSYNLDNDTNINFYPINKYVSAIYNSEIDHKTDKLVPVGESLGISLALSTISNLRGFDASDMQLLIYDEMIPQDNERPIRNEGQALLNALETIGRNRELRGQKPLKLLALSNSNDVMNPVFITLRLVGIADNMLRKNQEIYIDGDRGILLIILKNSPISEKKRNTALYKLSGDGDFYDMSIKNKFTKINYSNVTSQNLIEYRMICIVGELAIYKHKSRFQYYITTHRSGSTRQIYNVNINDLRRFRIEQRRIWIEYIMGNIFFESYTLQALFDRYYKNKI